MVGHEVFEQAMSRVDGRAERSQFSLTESGLPPVTSPIRSSVARSFTTSDIKQPKAAQDATARKAKTKSRRTSKKDLTLSSKHELNRSPPQQEWPSTSDTSPGLPPIVAPKKVGQRRSADAQSSRRSIHAQSLRGDGRDNEGEEISLPKYGFWNGGRDMRRYKGAKAAAKADPRKLEELHVSDLLDRLAKEESGRAAKQQQEAKQNNALGDKPAVPMQARRTSVISNLLNKRRESFATGLQSVRDGYTQSAGPLQGTLGMLEDEDSGDCPQGFARLSGLGSLLSKLPSINPAPLSKTGKRMTKSRPTIDFNSLLSRFHGKA
eukprot:jgi/Tetstr1/453161/TSEL_040179.t1